MLQAARNVVAVLIQSCRVHTNILTVVYATRTINSNKHKQSYFVFIYNCPGIQFAYKIVPYFESGTRNGCRIIERTFNVFVQLINIFGHSNVYTSSVNESTVNELNSANYAPLRVPVRFIGAKTTTLPNHNASNPLLTNQRATFWRKVSKWRKVAQRAEGLLSQ